MATVAVFIDYQNVYRRARDAFTPKVGASHWDGQINPRLVGDEIVNLGRVHDPSMTLAFVRIYRGLPDGGRDPKGHGACSKQVSAWKALPAVEVTTRPLRYPWGYPAEKPTEKGIDVQLAIDFVLMAQQKRFDVGVIFSADTDLRPALEAVRTLKAAQVAVAAWKPPSGYPTRLSLPGAAPVWCHFLSEAVYRRVADPTDYTM